MNTYIQVVYAFTSPYNICLEWRMRRHVRYTLYTCFSSLSLDLAFLASVKKQQFISFHEKKYSVRSGNKLGRDVTEIGESRLENLTQQAIIPEEKIQGVKKTPMAIFHLYVKRHSI